MMRPVLTRAPLAAAVFALSVACTGLRGRSEQPYIETIRPDSVMLSPGAVVEIVVRGRGFSPGTPGRNTIHFGGTTIGDVPASADGREIRFMVPERIPVRGDAAPLPLEAGRYNLSVQTSVGTSNDVAVRVDR